MKNNEIIEFVCDDTHDPNEFYNSHTPEEIREIFKQRFGVYPEEVDENKD